MENEIDNFNRCIDQVQALIASLSNSLRQMSLSALDLQGMALSKKHQIEETIERINDLGEIINQLIKFLEKLICCYIIVNDRFDCQHLPEYPVFPTAITSSEKENSEQ